MDKQPKFDYSDIKFKDNGKLKLIIVVGTRPEIIRLAAAKIRYFSMSYIILLNNIRLFNFFVSVYYD